MIRAASALLLAVMLCVAVPAFAQQAPAPAAVTSTRQVFQALIPGMMRDQVAKVVGSQGPMDLKQETWGRWTPGAKPGHVEILRVHFYENRVYWVEYDAFTEAWTREEKGGCSGWMKGPMRRLKESFDIEIK